MVLGYSPNSLFQYYCGLNMYARKAQQAGAIGILQLDFILEDNFSSLDSLIEESQNDTNYVFTNAYDTSVTIFIAKLSRFLVKVVWLIIRNDGARLLKLYFDGKTQVTFEPVSEESFVLICTF